ncbi:MAG: hypothetical protein D6776_04970 [Planctomycetota bacterium]|nr:MAG: hypothetical protein D6776_04970 [Planctomycetota bacterium]
MICPHCERDTSPADGRCTHCGGALDLTFDELSGIVVLDEEQRREWRVQAQARSVLLLGSIVFVLGLFAWLWLLPPVPRVPVVPVYDPAETAVGTEGGATAGATLGFARPGPPVEPRVPRGRRR